MPVCLHAWNWFSANSTTQCIGGLRCGQPWRQSLTFLCSASAPWPQYFILFPTKSRENGFICLCVFLLPKKYRIACFCLCWYRTDSGWLELIMIRSNYKYYGSPVVRERKEKITKGQPCHLWQLNLHFFKKKSEHANLCSLYSSLYLIPQKNPQMFSLADVVVTPVSIATQGHFLIFWYILIFIVFN